MTTVVDAFVMTLGLDASNFIRCQKEVVSSLDKTKEKAVKSGKSIEKSAKGITESLSKATSSALDLAAVFLGVSSIGIKQFIADSAAANTSLGRLSAGIGQSSEALSAWSIAARRMGGSAGATLSSLQAISDMLVDFRSQGKVPPMELFLLSSKSGVNIDYLHGVQNFLITSANAASKLAKTDPAAANLFLRRIGLDPVTAALLIRQGPRMRAYLEEQKRLAPNDKDIGAATQLTAAWGKLGVEVDLLASKITTALGPELIGLADVMGKIVEAIAHWVEANPGWTEAITTALTLLAGAQIVKAVANIVALQKALVGLTEANAAGLGGGVLGFLSANPWIAGVVAGGYVLSPTAAGDANEIEQLHRRNEQYGHRPGGATPLSGNDAIRRRGSGGPDIGLGPPGKLSANQREAYAAARGEGLSDKAARALVANMSGEGLNVPHDVHRDGKQYAHGIVQWDDKRSADIKAHFGKMPNQMSVAEQTRAAIWEIQTNPRFARTKRALGGDNAGNMIGTLVDNYESPADVGGAIAKRSKIYQGLGDLGGAAQGLKPVPVYPASGPGAYKPPKDPILTGQPHIGGLVGLRAGAAHAAALNNISNDNRATTTSSSSEMHIGSVHVNAPNATDAHGIANHIDSALASSMFAHFANYGPD